MTLIISDIQSHLVWGLVMGAIQHIPLSGLLGRPVGAILGKRQLLLRSWPREFCAEFCQNLRFSWAACSSPGLERSKRVENWVPLRV